MSEAWNRGDRDDVHRTPLQDGEHQGREDDRKTREDHHILVGVSHASDNPARHRNFEIRAVFDAAAGGWVADVREQNFNDQPGAWAPVSTTGPLLAAFPTAAACMGNAVATLVAMVDRAAAE